MQRNSPDLSGDLQDTASAIKELEAVISEGSDYPDTHFEADICNALRSVNLAIRLWMTTREKPLRPAEPNRPIMIGRRGYGVV